MNSPRLKAVITDADFPDLNEEHQVFAAAGVDVTVAKCKTAADVIAAGQEADGLLVHWAPITAEVLDALPRCRIIVRYGIGVDNIDLEAARTRGIAVSNIPDYASGEVADHTLALALSLARQLTPIDQRLRSGKWKIVPDLPMPSFREMRFVTLGFGKIAREVAARARAFGFQLAAHDPFVSAEALRAAGTEPLDLETAISTADLLSLHLPLNAGTKHLINAPRLTRMKPTALLINTSRGGLIDSTALAAALIKNQLLGAALDVYEREPLPADDPIRSAPRTLLTSHVAWYSDASLPRLQRMSAEEVVRGVRGETLRSPVNFPLCSVSTTRLP
jgi:D-3-phosphoglycerate dehydrogenase